MQRSFTISMLVALVVGPACRAELGFRSETRVSCERPSDCPTGWTCSSVLGRCVLTGGGSGAVDFGDEPVVTPSLGKSGTTFTLEFSLTGQVDLEPVVKLDTGDAFVPSERDGGYRYTYTASGAEDAGVHLIDIAVVDSQGATQRLSGGSLELDFTPPHPSIAWSTSDQKTAVHEDDVIAFAITLDADEYLLAANLLTCAGDSLRDVLGVFSSTAGAYDGTVSLAGLELTSVACLLLDVTATDEAGNLTASGSATSAPIPVDVDAPSGARVEIRGKPVTTSQTVDVELSATGATWVKLEGDLEGEDQWLEKTIPAVLSVTLSAAAGDKVVGARFRDDAHNESGLVVDVISFMPTDTNDEVQPQLVTASALSATSVMVAFSESMDSVDLANVSLYAATGLTLSDPQPSGTGQTVLLTTTTQSAGDSHSLTVTGAHDLAGNVIDPAASTKDFTGYGLADDPSAPDLLVPVDGETVVSSARQTELSWTARAGAAEYSVEVFTDSALTVPWSGAFPIMTSQTSMTFTAEDDQSYWWRVRSDLAPLAFSPARVMSFLSSSIYVSCNESSACDEPDQYGTKNQPYQQINRAVALAASRPQPWSVMIAARGGGAEYAETVIVPPDIALKGGYTDSFSELDRDTITHSTVIATSGLAALVITGASSSAPVAIDGLTLQGSGVGFSTAVYISESPTGVSFRDSTVTAGDAAGIEQSFAAYVINSGSALGEGATFESVTIQGDDSGGKNAALYARNSAVNVIAESTVLGGSGGSERYGIYGRFVYLTIHDSTVRGGEPAGGSWAVDLSASEVDIRRSTLMGGDISYGRSVGLQMWTGWGVVANNVLGGGQGGVVSYGYSAGIVVGARSSGIAWITNNVIFGGASPNATSVAIAVKDGDTLIITNNILFTSEAQYRFCYHESYNLADPSASVQNNLFVDCPDAAFSLYDDQTGTPCHTVDGPHSCYTTEAELNDETLFTEGIVGTASGNIGVETVADLATIGFAGTSDFHFTAGSPATLTAGGKDPSSNTCGANLTESCGGLTDDCDLSPRPGGDSLFSMGACEP